MSDESPSIALATCEEHPGFVAGDDAPLVQAFKSAGCRCRLVRWDAPDTDWSSFDAVVIRSTWDYQERLDDYLRWAALVDETTRLLNPLGVVRANIRKTYLLDLRDRGVPTVPTAWLVEGGSLAEALEGTGWEDAIIKPAIGAGASGLIRFGAGRADEISRVQAHADRCMEQNLGPMLIQPWLPSIVDTGETSVVVIDGEVSHAVRKVPADDDFRVQIEFGGRYTVVEPSKRQAEVALDACAAAESLHGPLLYARVDLVEPEPGDPALIELELIEPELFFPIVPDAAGRFAGATLRALRKNANA